MEKITKKNSKNSNVVTNNFATNPLTQQELPPKAFTEKAIELYEKQADIKRYTDLVLKDEISDEFLGNVNAELLLKDIFNPFEDESYKRLAQNEKLLEDLTSDMD